MAVSYKPDYFNTVTTFLAVPDARAQVEFMEKAFGAKVLTRMEDDKGVVHHAELDVIGTVLMVGQPDKPSDAHPSTLYLYVEDVDSFFKKAVEAGGIAEQEPETKFYGDRSGVLRDSNGNHWWIATHVEDITEEEMMKRMQEYAQG